MSYVAGIDIGTSSCKTIILNCDGRAIASATKEYFALAGDKADMNPEDWWRGAVDTLKMSCKKANIDPKEIVSVGCSGQMQGCTFIGKDGKHVRNSMLWYGTAPKNVCVDINKGHEQTFIDNCYMPLLSSLTAAKIAWVMKHEPDVWKKTDKFLFAPSYIAFMLTGNIAVDKSNLGLSGLNNVVENNWSQDLLDIIGVGPSKIPSLLNCDEIMGYVNKRAALETGLKEGIPVIAGCGDGPAESYSVNITDRSEIKLRLGSAGCANAVIPKDWLHTKVEKASPFVKDNYYSIGGYTTNCALAVKWVRGVYFSELAQEDKSYDLMDNEAKNCTVGTDGLMFHPYLNGEAAYYNDPNMTAKFTGIKHTHRRGDFLHAAYEGISFSVRDMIENDKGLNLMDKIVFCGGATKSDVWMSILVDVLGRGGVIPKSADAAFGVALMAGEKVGLFDAGKAADASRQEGRTVDFNPENNEKYNKIYKEYIERVRTK